MAIQFILVVNGGKYNGVDYLEFTSEDTGGFCPPMKPFGVIARNEWGKYTHHSWHSDVEELARAEGEPWPGILSTWRGRLRELDGKVIRWNRRMPWEVRVESPDDPVPDDPSQRRGRVVVIDPAANAQAKAKAEKKAFAKKVEEVFLGLGYRPEEAAKIIAAAGPGRAEDVEWWTHINVYEVDGVNPADRWDAVMMAVCGALSPRRPKAERIRRAFAALNLRLPEAQVGSEHGLLRFLRGVRAVLTTPTFRLGEVREHTIPLE